MLDPRSAEERERKRQLLSSGIMRRVRVAEREGRGREGGSRSREGLGLRVRERGVLG